MNWQRHKFVPTFRDEGCAYCPFGPDCSVHDMTGEEDWTSPAAPRAASRFHLTERDWTILAAATAGAMIAAGIAGLVLG